MLKSVSKDGKKLEEMKIKGQDFKKLTKTDKKAHPRWILQQGGDLFVTYEDHGVALFKAGEPAPAWAREEGMASLDDVVFHNLGVGKKAAVELDDGVGFVEKIQAQVTTVIVNGPEYALWA